MPKVTVHEVSNHLFVAEYDGRLVGTARLQPRPQGRHHQWQLEILVGDMPKETLIGLFDSIAKRVPLESIAWWVRGDDVQLVDSLAPALGVERHRVVCRMEAPLAAVDSKLETRGFTYDDAKEIVRINNDAFEQHPDRANMTVDDLFDEFKTLDDRFDDLRIIQIDGTAAGFVWLKQQSEPYGEVYVLALDEAHRGQGLGIEALKAGMEHLEKAHRASSAVLYVESTNTRAIEVYESAGFKDVDKPLVSFKLGKRL